ncbi:hypothetical protein GCM10023192_69380 [Amycolatopsis samaneae]
MLLSSLGALTAVGLGAGLAGTPAVAAPVASDDCSPFPPVPGMTGDRRANEFWYQYDEKFQYHPKPEIIAAFGTCLQLFGSFAKFIDAWRASRKSRDYPQDFVALAAQGKEPLAVISRAQLDHIDEYYGHNRRGLVSAFADIGQGCLYDPRRGPGERAHMMGTGNPTSAWHQWHVITRSMMFLGIDTDRWTGLLSLIGYGWAVQTIADPKVDAHNPRLPDETLSRLARVWLSKTPADLDTDFDSYPYPPGHGS